MFKTSQKVLGFSISPVFPLQPHHESPKPTILHIAPPNPQARNSTTPLAAFTSTTANDLLNKHPDLDWKGNTLPIILENGGNAVVIILAPVEDLATLQVDLKEWFGLNDVPHLIMAWYSCRIGWTVVDVTAENISILLRLAKERTGLDFRLRVFGRWGG